MPGNFTLVIRAADRIYANDTATGFTVSIPPDIPHGVMWKVTFSYVIGFLSGSNAYSLQVKCPLVGALSTAQSGDDGFRSVVVLNGTEPGVPMPLYINGNPRLMSIRLLTQSSGIQVVSAINSEIITHWERLTDEEDKEICSKCKSKC